MPRPVQSAAPSTSKGRATRDRIVVAAAELMYRNGAGATSTPAVRDAAGVSSSQIYHYFSDKEDLTTAVAAHQAESVVGVQSRALGEVDDLDGLDRWRDLVVNAAQSSSGVGGCPLGSLASELADEHPLVRDELATGFSRWQRALRDALTTLVDNGTLHGADADRLAAALLAAVQGGLLVAQATRSTAVLEAGLDTVLEVVRSHASAPAQ